MNRLVLILKRLYYIYMASTLMFLAVVECQ